MHRWSNIGQQTYPWGPFLHPVRKSYPDWRILIHMCQALVQIDNYSNRIYHKLCWFYFQHQLNGFGTTPGIPTLLTHFCMLCLDSWGPTCCVSFWCSSLLKATIKQQAAKIEGSSISILCMWAMCPCNRWLRWIEHERLIKPRQFKSIQQIPPQKNILLRVVPTMALN